MDAKAYRRLRAWQRSMDLVDAVYDLTEAMPDSERFGLISQIRRAAVSVPANIAEGYGRAHRGEYLQHLSISRGSLMELETHLIIAVRRDMVPREQALKAWQLAQESGRLLTTLTRSLKN